MTVGQRLKQKRKALGLTQTVLAKTLGVGQDQIARWEGGVYTPSREQIVALSRALNVTTDWLLGMTRENETRLTGESLSPDEQRLIELYRDGQLPISIQQLLLSLSGRDAEENLVEDTPDESNVS